MCETLKRIKLLVITLQKDGLKIPVQIYLGKWLCMMWEISKVR